MRGFFGQEGRHAQAHERFFETMRAQGCAVDELLEAYERFAYGSLEKNVPARLRLSITVALEHFTAILAEDALNGEGLAGAHPAMRRLLQWHAVEELEHKAVAFDVLRAVHPSYRLRIVGLALASLALGGFWIHMTKQLLEAAGMTFREGLRELREVRKNAPPGSMTKPIVTRVSGRASRATSDRASTRTTSTTPSSSRRRSRGCGQKGSFRTTISPPLRSELRSDTNAVEDEMTDRFEGRRVLVTGAASGIGRATAIAFAKVGAKLIVCDVDEKGLEDVARETNAVLSTRVDVSKRDQMADLARRVHEDGPLEVLVNNAGVGLAGGVLDTSLEDWEWILSINLWASSTACTTSCRPWWKRVAAMS